MIDFNPRAKKKLKRDREQDPETWSEIDLDGVPIEEAVSVWESRSESESVLSN
jgi:hypothetical protein